MRRRHNNKYEINNQKQNTWKYQQTLNKATRNKIDEATHETPKLTIQKLIIAN